MWRIFEQRESPEQRLSKAVIDLRDQAEHMPPGVARDAVLRRARQAETDSQKDQWLKSSGLRSPN